MGVLEMLGHEGERLEACNCPHCRSTMRADASLGPLAGQTFRCTVCRQAFTWPDPWQEEALVPAMAPGGPPTPAWVVMAADDGTLGMRPAGSQVRLGGLAYRVVGRSRDDNDFVLLERLYEDAGGGKRRDLVLLRATRRVKATGRG